METVVDIGPYGRLVVTIELPGGGLDRMERKLENPDPLLRKTADFFEGVFRQNFSEGGRPPWAELKPATVARKQRMGLPPRKNGLIQHELVQQGQFAATNKLIASGGLLRSYTGAGTGHIRRIESEDRTVEVGSQYTIQTKYGSVNLAVVHQKGSEKRSIPARPQTLTEDDEKALCRIVEEYYAG